MDINMTQQTQSPLKQKFAPMQEYPYKFRKGQEIKIVFLDSKSITGIVSEFSRYHIVLEVEGKDEIVTAFKHAIKYILSKKTKTEEYK